MQRTSSCVQMNTLWDTFFVVHMHVLLLRPTTCCSTVYPKCWTSTWWLLCTSCKATWIESRALPRFNCNNADNLTASQPTARANRRSSRGILCGVAPTAHIACATTPYLIRNVNSLPSLVLCRRGLLGSDDGLDHLVDHLCGSLHQRGNQRQRYSRLS